MRAECFRSFKKPSIAKLDEKYHIQFPQAQPCLLADANQEYLCGCKYQLISEAGVRYNTTQGHQSQGTACSGSIGRSFPDSASLVHNRFH